MRIYEELFIIKPDATEEEIDQVIPDRNDEFNLKKVSGVSVRFVADAQGKVTEMAVNTDDGVFTARRKP